MGLLGALLGKGKQPQAPLQDTQISGMGATPGGVKDPQLQGQQGQQGGSGFGQLLAPCRGANAPSWCPGASAPVTATGGTGAASTNGTTGSEGLGTGTVA